jgi:dihydroorotase
MVGHESALRVVHQSMEQPGLIGWDDVARVMSAAPARIGRLSGHGTPLEVGRAAHIALYDASAAGVFTAADLHGRSVNSPYLGRELPGRVEYTLHGGVLTVDGGAVVAELGDRSGSK